jgi:hypothetical protein
MLRPMPLPASASDDAARLVGARALRAFADGFFRSLRSDEEAPLGG